MKELTLSLDASTSATGWAVYDGPEYARTPPQRELSRMATQGN